jgi:hypothetical protein
MNRTFNRAGSYPPIQAIALPLPPRTVESSLIKNHTRVAPSENCRLARGIAYGTLRSDFPAIEALRGVQIRPGAVRSERMEAA